MSAVLDPDTTPAAASEFSAGRLLADEPRYPLYYPADRAARWCLTCHRVAVQPDQHQCTPQGEK